MSTCASTGRPGGATHGRSFWLLDDLAPLRSAAAKRRADAADVAAGGADVAPRSVWDTWVGRRGPTSLGRFGVDATFMEHRLPGGGRHREFLDAAARLRAGLLPATGGAGRPRSAVDAGGRLVRRFGSNGADDRDGRLPVRRPAQPA